tara:strand:+ start:462 stop:620 length:159 start_codon:yes stop_codon:yes gene_type:complete
MDQYEYAIMKETLERIAKSVVEWRKQEEQCFDVSYDAMYEIETAIGEAGYHE